MTRVLELLISLLIVVVLFVVVGVILPSGRRIQHSVETNRPLTVIYDSLNGFKRFHDWNPLRQHDSQIQYTLSGPDMGVGARLDYASRNKKIGDGSWEIVESEPEESIKMALDNEAYGSDKSMSFRLKKTGKGGRNVEITQTYGVKYGWNLFGRYAGLYVNRNVGDDMKRGLANFSNLMATIPKFDYSKLEHSVEVVELQPQNTLYVPTNAERRNDAILLAMDNNTKWIKQVMEKSGLEPAGPLRVVTTEYGAENYAFDLVQPVRKKGTGPAEEKADENTSEDSAEAGESGEDVADEEPEEIVFAAAQAEAVEPLDPASVKLEGPVKIGQTYGGRALVTRYNGHPAGLAAARDSIRAWGLVRGESVQDRPFDEYLVDHTESFGGDGEFNAYWPIR